MPYENITDNPTAQCRQAAHYECDLNVVYAQVRQILAIPHSAVVADCGDGVERLHRDLYGASYPKVLRNFLTRVMGDRIIDGVRFPAARRIGLIR
jgi:hypothetical protein